MTQKNDSRAILLVERDIEVVRRSEMHMTLRSLEEPNAEIPFQLEAELPNGRVLLDMNKDKKVVRVIIEGYEMADEGLF